MNRLLALALPPVLVLLPAAAHAEALDLVCHGSAFHTDQTLMVGHVETDDGQSASGSATTYRRGRTEESLRLHLDGAGGGRLKLPVTLVPPISRGRDGWWDFTKLDVSDETIRGQFSLNVLNHPSVVIDRHTGDIDLKGMGIRFNGSCERAPDAADARKF